MAHLYLGGIFMKYLRILFVSTFCLLVGCTYFSDSVLSTFAVPNDAKDLIYLYEDPQGDLWIADEDAGIYYMGANTNSWEKVPLPELLESRDINFLVSYDNNVLWLGTENGLWSYETEHAKWQEQSLANVKVRSSIQDSEGNIWVGTGDDGVYVLDSIDRGWQPLAIDGALSSRLTIRTMYQDSRDNIWLSGDVLYKYSPVEDSWSLFSDGDSRYSDELEAFVQPSDDIVTLPDDYITSIYEASDGKLLFGTLTAGVLVYDYNTQLWMNYSVSDGLIDENVKMIVEDLEGNLWFGTSSGVSKFNPQTNEWESFRVHNDLLISPVGSNIIVRDGGTVMFASSNALQSAIYQYTPNK